MGVFYFTSSRAFVSSRVGGRAVLEASSRRSFSGVFVASEAVSLVGSHKIKSKGIRRH